MYCFNLDSDLREPSTAMPTYNKKTEVSGMKELEVTQEVV